MSDTAKNTRIISLFYNLISAAGLIFWDNLFSRVPLGFVSGDNIFSRQLGRIKASANGAMVQSPASEVAPFSVQQKIAYFTALENYL